jgi:tetratricopeptide (TPR) repeat protein
VGERGALTLGKAIETIQVPATVQVILAARIDRLAPEDKQLLQAAAVIGKDVPFALLTYTCELGEEALRASLARLQAAEFVYEAALFPDLEYTFKHALTHEVAYGGLLGERKRELHARVVEAIETVHAERIGEHAERLAHHAVRGNLTDKAVEYLNEAGTKALMRSGYREAVSYFEEALRVAEGLPNGGATVSQRMKLRAGLGLALMNVKGPHSPEVRSFYAESVRLCDRAENAQERFQLLFGLWNCHLFGSDLESANQTASELLATASDKDDYQRLEAHHSMWTTKINLAQSADSLPHLDRAKELIGKADRSKWRTYAYHDPLVCSQSMGAIAQWSLGHFDQARRLATQGLETAQQVDHPMTRIVAAMAATTVCYQCGEFEAARQHAATQFKIATDLAISPWRERASVTLARLIVDEGRHDEALRILEGSLPVAGAAYWMMSGSIALALGAEIYVRAGQPVRAVELLRSFTAGQLAGLLCGPELHRLYGEVLLACSPDSAAEAESRFRLAIALGKEHQIKAFELRAALSLARLLAPRDRSEARDALAVVDWFTEGSDVADLRNARALRHDLG